MGHCLTTEGGDAVLQLISKLGFLGNGNSEPLGRRDNNHVVLPGEEDVSGPGKHARKVAYRALEAREVKLLVSRSAIRDDDMNAFHGQNCYHVTDSGSRLKRQLDALVRQFGGNCHRSQQDHGHFAFPLDRRLWPHIGRPVDGFLDGRALAQRLVGSASSQRHEHA